jgi:hypothetical protein
MSVALARDWDRTSSLRSFVVTSPAPAEVWNEIWESAPGALPSQTPDWLRCVCAVDGYEDATRLYETPDGRRLIVPLVRRRRLGPALTMEYALPIGWGPGGLVAEGGVVKLEDVRLIVADLARRQVHSVSLRPDPATAAIWELAIPPFVFREPRMAQTLVLDGDFDRVWRASFRSDTRNRIRRAERKGVVVERDDTGRLVPVFQGLYAKSVERWAWKEGVPLGLARWRAARREPSRKLSTVAATLGASCRVYGAFLDGQPVASIVVLFGRSTATYWRGAMAEKLAGPVHANYLLHRTAIQDAVEAGCTAYHMGDSAPGSPLSLFKSRFGAVEQHYSCYTIERLPISPMLARARTGVRQALQRRARRG